MRTMRACWYEVWTKKTHGGKLINKYGGNSFDNQREAKKAIKEAREKAISLGYKPSEFMIMIVDSIGTVDDDGETISDTRTYARA